MAETNPDQQDKVLDLMQADQSRSLWRNFIFNISLVVVLTGLAVFVGISISSKNLVEDSIERRAKAHFKDIVLTRRWSAQYGGVFVEKLPGVESNPYLVNPDITALDGKVYTKKNPALMTREISELALSEGDYQFHITSLKLRNPHNAPDDWEESALKSFENGVPEAQTYEQRGDRLYYRYMAPLLVEKSCLQCHMGLDYKVGEVRGGISVNFDVTDTENTAAFNRMVTMGVFLLTVSALLGLLYAFIVRISRTLTAAQERIKEIAVTDALTKLFNRRHFFAILEKEIARAKRYNTPMSCMMFDLDHFKMINDRYGHLTGDRVLKETAGIIRANIRNSDIAARYGGEEFIILLPQTTLEGAQAAAEKLRLAIAQKPIKALDGSDVAVTASFGVTEYDPRDADPVEVLLHRADKALYEAKAGGRNQVVVGALQASPQEKES